jgi:hypothetical protein
MFNVDDDDEDEKDDEEQTMPARGLILRKLIQIIQYQQSSHVYNIHRYMHEMLFIK